MNLQILRQLTLLSLLSFTASVGLAASGPLVSVTGTGGGNPFNVNVWLNGLGPLSGQSFTVTGGSTITVTPTIPGHTYPNMGIEITTPGYSFNAGCSQMVGNRCIFSASQETPAQITTTGASPACVMQSGQTYKVFLTATSFYNGNIATDGIYAKGFDSTVVCLPNQGNALARANCICNYDANKPSGATLYFAWLGTSTPGGAPGNIKYAETANYVRSDGTVVAGAGTLLGGSLCNSIGDSNVPSPVITGASPEGVTGGTCDNWTNNQIISGQVFAPGQGESTNRRWTGNSGDQGVLSCTGSYPEGALKLYCFGGPSS